MLIVFLLLSHVVSTYINWVSRLAPVSNVNFSSKTDNLSKIAIYKLYLEVEVLGLDIRLPERKEFLEDDFFHSLTQL